jgi:hypothetical protein
MVTAFIGLRGFRAATGVVGRKHSRDAKPVWAAALV